MNKINKNTRTYSLDKIDDLLRELEDSKIRINALMDYNLKLRRINDEQLNKNVLAYEYQRLSPIIELLNTETFESLEKAVGMLETNVTVNSAKIRELK